MPKEKFTPSSSSGPEHNQPAAKRGATFGAWNDPMRPLEIVWVSIDKIEQAPRRVRSALKKQVEAIQRSLERFGNRIPILVDGGNRVIDGHARLAAAQLLDATEMPCIVVDDLPEVEVRRLALSLNKIQETGEWDPDVLRIEINEIIQIDGDIEFPGFEMPEIEAIQYGGAGIEEPGKLDDISDLANDWPAIVARPGDIWIAGSHIVFCGRAQELPDPRSLLSCDDVAMVITDPPFNVRISGHVSTVSGRHPEFAEASGDLNPAAFSDFLMATLSPSLSTLPPGGIGFVFMDWRHIPELSEAFCRIGLEVINLAVWVKSASGMGGLYRSRHELVFVVRKPGASHRNNVQLGRYGRNRSNVWEYGGATSGNTDEDDFSVHPTVKPVAMIRDAILDVTAPGDVVLDCFLGSGTTLIAAETSQRRCFGVEIEPVYVDLSLRRWMDFTGHQPVHAASGKTFEAVRAERAIKFLPAPVKEGTDG